jgi:FkbM family methyltransferase
VRSPFHEKHAFLFKGMIKKALKYILYRIIGKPVYLVLRLFYIPSENMRRRMRFIGKFRVRAGDGESFRLFNNAFHLENHIFWLGIDRYPWERMSRQIWERLCRSSGTIFDIGANSGIYAVLAKVNNPNSLVVAFEPQPNVYHVLRKNNQVNGFDIRCEQLALSDREGMLPFYNYGPDTFTTENTTAGSLNKQWVTRDQSSIMVAVRKLESYIEEHDIPGIDLMKIDVETLEFDVLCGYGKYLGMHRPAILLEVQNREIGERVEALFNPDQYTFYNIDEMAGLRKVTGLGASEKYLNYLLCPLTRQDQISEFIVPG